LIVVFALFFTVIYSSQAYAQIQQDSQKDTDADGVLDNADVCPSTNLEEGLPIVIRDKEYLGCSCSQIYEKLGDIYCYDIMCATGRPLSLNPRADSSRETDCSSDYCINYTLYDYPEKKQVLCVDGKELNYSCDPAIIENSALCMNGSVKQYEEQTGEKPVLDTDNKILLDDYEKLQKRAYAISQDVTIRTGLGISGETIFLARSQRTMDAIKIEKHLTTESKVFGNTEKTISTKNITIIPNRHRVLKKVYVFEELPRGAKVNLVDVIPKSETIYKENGPVILVWEIEKVSKPTVITYQINAPLQGDSNTLVVAKEIKNTLWKFMIVPFIVIVGIVIFFIRASQKSVPRSKKIFKE
jgi:hypothetical protein